MHNIAIMFYIPFTVGGKIDVIRETTTGGKIYF